MDTSLLSLISNGGPMALIAVIAWVVKILRDDLRSLQKEFRDFQISQISSMATKADIAALNQTLNQIFELLRDQQGICGRDCIAMQQIRRKDSCSP
ncbi:MAG: hypothetical protein HQL95_01785 [Magnetococcales bacterium]|nr:hypothetical protein [Magnetococcales bacterium]